MGKVVLTIDDSRPMRELLHTALTAAGFEVLQAEDGHSALEVLRTAVVDVIVTDLVMPNLDGFDLVEQVRREARHQSTPILVLTTESDLAKKARARDAGASGWVVKPFNPALLIDAINRATP